MGFLVSPGVEVKETDLTNIIPALSTSVGGYAGFFRWGPINTPVNIGSETDLVRTFGAPSVKNTDLERSFLTAASFLKYSNTLRVIRANDNSKNAHSSNDFTAGYGYGSTADGIGYGSTSQTGPAASTLKINDIGDLSLATAGLQAAGIRLVARYSGELGNSLGVAVIDGGTQPWDEPTLVSVKTAITYKPSNTDWSESQSKIFNVSVIQDELTIVVYDRLGLITGTPGEVLESYQGLSYFTGAKNSSGQSIYWADVLNNNSAYVWGVSFTTDKSGLTSAEYNGTFIVNELFDGTHIFEGGSDATAFDASENGLSGALSLFENTDLLDINFIFAHNFESQTYVSSDQKNIDDLLIEIAIKRKDCMAFISAPLSVAALTTNSQKLAAIKTKFDSVESTSYAVLDSTPLYVYNRYRDSFVWIPACGHIAGLCARTDNAAEPWFSPAGFNRGNLLGVTKLAYNPNQIDRDDLYSNRVNPIISSPGDGILLFGDKTALKKPSAFDRINVRRLFITIEKAIATASKFLLFELNDEFTRATFINSVEPYLRGVQGRRGITDFRVICDNTNNTPEVIDSNRFVGSIFIKPSRSINFITLNFVAVRTGVAFEEITGA